MVISTKSIGRKHINVWFSFVTLPLGELSMRLVTALLMGKALRWSASQVCYCHEVS